MEKQKGVHTSTVTDLQEPSDPVWQGDTSVCTPSPFHTPSVPALPPAENDLLQGIFEETFKIWFQGKKAWENFKNLIHEISHMEETAYEKYALLWG